MYDNTEPIPAYVTYGGVEDRPNDVNHPDNLTAVAASTDPAAPHNGVPEGYTYDAENDTYVRNGN